MAASSSLINALTRASVLLLAVLVFSSTSEACTPTWLDWLPNLVLDIFGGSCPAERARQTPTMSTTTNNEAEDQAKAVKLLLDMMEIDSTTTREAELADWLAARLESGGWTVLRQLVSENPRRVNLFATRQQSSNRVGGPKLVLNSHLDTVPPYLAPSKDADNVFGRGANDAKGQMAAMITAAERVAQEDPELAHDIALLFVVGEEVDHIGMTKANELGLLPDYLIVGEPTELQFARLQKGALKVRVKVTGRAGHSGYPEEGDSAVHRLVLVLHDLLAHQWPSDTRNGDTTLNVGLIEGGQALNAWAAQAHADIFIRVTTNVQDARAHLDSVIAGRAEVETLGQNEPVHLTGSPFEDVNDTVVAFNTDIAYFKNYERSAGIFLLGPGSIKNAHSVREFMPIADLGKAVVILARLIRHCLNAAAAADRR